MENRITKITVLIIFLIVTLALIIGYETLRLVSALKEKRKLTARIVELSGQKAVLETDLLQNNSVLKATKERLKSLEEESSYLQGSLREKSSQEIKLQKQVSLAQAKLKALDQANNFLEKEIEGLNVSKKSVEDELNRIKDEVFARKGMKVYFKENINSLKQALDEKEKESLALKKELTKSAQEKEALQSRLQAMDKSISNLQAKYQDAQTELTLTRKQYRKMVDEVNKAAIFNAFLQQSLAGLSQSVTQEEENREKARELKNKVEVILMPQENKE